MPRGQETATKGEGGGGEHSPVLDPKQVLTDQVENLPGPDNEAAHERTGEKKRRVEKEQLQEERGRKERNKERKERSSPRKLAGEPFTRQARGWAQVGLG